MRQKSLLILSLSHCSAQRRSKILADVIPVCIYILCCLTHRFLLKGDFGISATGIICSPGLTHIMGPSSLSVGFISLRLENVPHGRVRCSQTDKRESFRENNQSSVLAHPLSLFQLLNNSSSSLSFSEIPPPKMLMREKLPPRRITCLWLLQRVQNQSPRQIGSARGHASFHIQCTAALLHAGMKEI